MKDAAKDTRQTASAELIPKIDATLEEHRYETAKRDFETASCVQPQIRRRILMRERVRPRSDQPVSRSAITRT
jgi:hypothetical protein